MQVLIIDDVRYIADGAMPFSWLSVAQSFVAHYPDYAQYKNYMKLNTAANAPMYLPLWGEEELNIVRKRMHPEISEWQVSIRNTEPSLFPNLQIST